MRIFLISGIILAACAASVQPVRGQSSVRYQLMRSALAGGGLISSSSSRYQLGSTFGQPAVPGPNSVRFSISGGFWHVPAAYLNFTKSSSGSDLTSGVSWTGGTAPGSANIATWNPDSLATPLTLNSPLSWAGFSLLGGVSDVSISGNGPLTLGAAGIDMSASPVNLILNLPIVLGANQTWSVDAGHSLLTSGVISGGGGLVKSGYGLLLLTNADAYTGGTTVNGGVLALDFNPGDTPTGTLAAGTTISVNAGGTLRLDREDVLGYGAGFPAQLSINGGLVVSASVANTTPVQSGGASFRVTLPALNFTGGTLSSGTNNVGDLNGGSYVAAGPINTLASSNTVMINAYSISLQGTTFTVAAGTTLSSVDLYVSSILQNLGGNPESLTKSGPGVMILNNANAYTGGTIVNGGVLALDYNPGDNPTGTLAAGTTLTVNSGGTLRLDGEDVLGFYGGSLGQLNINGGLVTSANVAYPTPVQYGGTSFRVTLPTVTFSGGTLSSGTNMLGDAYGGSYLVQGAVNTLASSTTAVINAHSVSLQNTTFNVAAGSTPSGVDLSVVSILNNWVSGAQSLTKAGNGVMVLWNANSYSGPTTINAGTLALAGSGSIANTPKIAIAGGARFDVSGLSSPFVLRNSQTLSNSTTTAVLAGNASTASGTVWLTYASGTPALAVTNGTLTLSSSTTFKMNNTGSQLPIGKYTIISTSTGGLVAGAVPTGTVAVGGGGAAASGVLSIVNGELNLVVGNPVNTTPTNIVASVSGRQLILQWQQDHTGWTLQSNAISLSNPNDWFAVPGSTTTNKVIININSQSTVFYRLTY
jgi:autotransporter-associated beta strand protein